MSHTLGQKVEAATRLLTGMRLPDVKRELEPHGFTVEVIDEGLARLRRVLVARHETPGGGAVEQKVVHLRTLEAFVGLWFPIARHVLNNAYPQAGERLFQGLRQADGPEIVVVLRVFLERLDAMGAGDPAYGPNAPLALNALALRGLTTSVRQAGRFALEDFTKPPASLRSKKAAREGEAEALERLWAWYLEWSVIARKVITHRNRRLALGLTSRELALALG